jgi:hypothetical protein
MNAWRYLPAVVTAALLAACGAIPSPAPDTSAPAETAPAATGPAPPVGFLPQDSPFASGEVPGGKVGSGDSSGFGNSSRSGPSAAVVPQPAVAAAGKEAIASGGARVAVYAVAVRRVQYVANRKRVLSDEPHLLVGLALLAANANRPCFYRPWLDLEPPFATATLTDERGRELDAVPTPPDAVLRGRALEGPLWPTRPTLDLLVFRRPEPDAGSLLLELPAANVDGEGFLRFRIPWQPHFNGILTTARADGVAPRRSTPRPLASSNPEAAALAKLKLAKQLLDDGYREKGLASLRELLKRYPGTAAADQAEALIAAQPR